MKQTAVEWLEQEFIALQNYGINELGLFSKAKAIEKEQIVSFAKLWEEKLLDGRINSVDDLYNDTYGN